MGFILVFANFAASQVRPDLSPVEPNPDTTNFEVYGQKNGNLRRATLAAIGKYVLENLSFSYSSSTDLIISQKYGVNSDTIDLSSLVPDLSLTLETLSLGDDDVDLGPFNQTLSLDTGADILTISDATGASPSTVSLASYDNLNSVSTESYFGGDGTSGSPLSINDNELAPGKIGPLTAQTLLGRAALTNGAAQEITVGSGLSLSSGGVLSATAGGDNIEVIFASGIYGFVMRYSGATAPTVSGSSGAFTIDVPSGTVLKSFRLGYTGSGTAPYDGSGDLAITVDWEDGNDYGINGVLRWHLFPDVTLIDLGSGNQLNNQGSGYQINHEEGSIEASILNLSGLNGIGNFMVICTF